MSPHTEKLLAQLQAEGMDAETEKLARQELEESPTEHQIESDKNTVKDWFQSIYEYNDFEQFGGMLRQYPAHVALQTLDELLDKDKQREEDGFPRRIRLGKLIKPGKGQKGEMIIVPSTTETKFYHDDSISEDGEQGATGGAGEGAEGEVLGEQPIDPQEGEEGEGQGAGEGGGASHEVGTEAFDLGKILTEKFQLPNLKDKGKKPSLTKFKYDLTDRNRGFGQLLDKKATLRRMIETNILLGRVTNEGELDTTNFLMNPKDEVYRVLSKEKDFESQAVVFFLRDYSGSMHGKPTEVVSTQHLFIYSWLIYQYKNNVETRFILHDTEAKEVEDFYTYYKSSVAGGTQVFPAFELVNKIVEEEQLARDYNIYVFHGTDGDDWDNTGKRTIKAMRFMMTYVNRIGISVVKNGWNRNAATTVERYINRSGVLQDHADLIRMDSMLASEVPETRIIEGIKKLID